MRYYSLLLIALLAWGLSFGQTKNKKTPFVKPAPSPVTYVNDFGKFLAAGEISSLEKQLVGYRKQTSHVIVIVTLNTLTDAATQKTYTVEEAALQYFNTWGIGDSIKNNGVLIMVSRQPRSVRIEVGKGLEDILTYTICKQIIDEQLTPNFKKGAFYTGFQEAIAQLKEQLNKGASAGAATHLLPAEPEVTTTQQATPDVFETVTHSSDMPLFYGAMVLIIAFAGGLGLLFYKLMTRVQSGVFDRNGFNHQYHDQYNHHHGSFTHNDQYSSMNNMNAGAAMASTMDSFSSSSSSDSFSSSGSSSDSFGGGSSDGGGASGSW